LKRFNLKMKYKNMLEGYALLLPWILGTILFFIVPVYQSMLLSLSKLESMTRLKMNLIGFKHYERAIFWDLTFIPLFLDTIKQAITNTPLIIVFSLFISLLLNRKIRFTGFFRGVYVLPLVLGTGYIMNQVLGRQVIVGAEGAIATTTTTQLARGIIIPEEMLEYLGPAVRNIVTIFLNQLTVMLWKSGVQIVLFLGGLQSISSSLYESAYCDGANEWEMFWKITLPMLSPTILLNIIFTIVDSFTDASNPMIYAIMHYGFYSMQFEYSAAISWLYLLFILLFVGVIFLIFNRNIAGMERRQKGEIYS